jgi:hypothetical protein
MEYYNVNTISELAEIMKIGQPAISKWRNNNSINPVKKKCRELGIYDKIFSEEIAYDKLGDYDKRPDFSYKNFIDNFDDVLDTLDNENKFYDNLQKRIIKITTAKSYIKVDEKIIDKYTLDLFKDNYLKAIEFNNLKEFRIHLIEYTFKNDFFCLQDKYRNKDSKQRFERIVALLNSIKIDEQIIDGITFDLFKEAYLRAVEFSEIKDFRVYLMKFTFNLMDSLSDTLQDFQES